MKNNPLFYTPSVARLCAQQGYLEKSAEIYAFLLEQDPENRDLRQALEDVNTRLSKPDSIKDSGISENRLEALVGTWVSLLVETICDRSLKRFGAASSGSTRMPPEAATVFPGIRAVGISRFIPRSLPASNPRCH